jgi:hypothetical protein
MADTERTINNLWKPIKYHVNEKNEIHASSFTIRLSAKEKNYVQQESCHQQNKMTYNTH